MKAPKKLLSLVLLTALLLSGCAAQSQIVQTAEPTETTTTSTVPAETPEETLPIETETPVTTPVSCTGDGFSITLNCPEGWEYQLVESEQDGYGIALRPEGEEGWLKLCWMESFGVCGTGLKETDYTLESGLTVRKGVYDGGDVWDFLVYLEPYEGYVALSEGMSAWYLAYEAQVMEILSTAQFSETAEN